MVGWHLWLNGHEFEQAPGVGEEQGSLVCFRPWGHKELDTTERLNNNNNNHQVRNTMLSGLLVFLWQHNPALDVQPVSIWKVIKWLPLLCEWSAKGSIKLVTGCIDAALLWYSATDPVLPTKYKDGVLKFSQVCRGESQHRILEFGSKSTLFSADYRYLLKKQLLAHHWTFFPFTFLFSSFVEI